mgnify:CR=1 FL=1
MKEIAEEPAGNDVDRVFARQIRPLVHVDHIDVAPADLTDRQTPLSQCWQDVSLDPLAGWAAVRGKQRHPAPRSCAISRGRKRLHAGDWFDRLDSLDGECVLGLTRCRWSVRQIRHAAEAEECEQ